MKRLLDFLLGRPSRQVLLDGLTLRSLSRDWYCIDCRRTVDLDAHMRCPACRGEAVAPWRTP